MKVILVTGLIGSGKSEVCRYLKTLGYSVYDSDSRTKALYSSVPGLVDRIEEAIGVPFSRVGVIFSDPARREALEKLVYPLVLEDFARWKSEQNSGPVFFESAIARQKPQFDGLFDAVLEIRSSEGLRYARNPLAASRSAIQTDGLHADWIIDNDGGLDALHAEIDRILDSLEAYA